MEDFWVDFCNKCIDDHEERLRVIEKNNKLEAKIEVKIDALDTRVDLLEKYVERQLAVLNNKKEVKHDTFSIIALVVACISLIFVGLKFIL